MWFFGPILLGHGLPLILMFGWIVWIKESANKFRFLQSYIIKTQLLVSTLFLFQMGSYFPPQVSLFHLVIKTPIQYWYYFLYTLTSIITIILFFIPYGRTINGARIVTILCILNVPLSWLGAGGILFRSEIEYSSDVLATTVFLFKIYMSLCCLLPVWAWSVVFGKLPATMYFSDKGLQSNIQNEDTFTGMLTKWITEDLKRMEQDIIDKSNELET